MKVFNNTKNALVSGNVFELKNIAEKSVGMLAFEKPRPIYFKTRFGVHTFGMKSPIDAVILDKKGIVRSIKKNMRPNRFFFWNPRYNRVLELPVGHNVGIGDYLKLSQT